MTKRGLGRREHEHRYAARTGSKGTLHKAIRRYGDENIVFEQIADFAGDYDLAMAYEAELVDKERPAYNLAPGGKNRVGELSSVTLARMRASHIGKPSSRKGKPANPETAAKLRGQKRTPEQRAKMSAAGKKRLAGQPAPMEGRKHTAEALAKMRAAKLRKPGPWAGKKRPEAAEWLRKANLGRPSPMRGVPKSSEHAEKIRAAKVGKPKVMTPAAVKAQAENYAKMLAAKYKAVECINDGKVYERVRDVPAAYNVSLSSVIRVLKGRSQSVKGWKFSYVGGSNVCK